MAIFNSYVTVYQAGYIPLISINIPLNHYKIPLNHYKSHYYPIVTNAVLTSPNGTPSLPWSFSGTKIVRLLELFLGFQQELLLLFSLPGPTFRTNGWPTDLLRASGFIVSTYWRIVVVDCSRLFQIVLDCSRLLLLLLLLLSVLFLLLQIARLIWSNVDLMFFLPFRACHPALTMPSSTCSWLVGGFNPSEKY